jgi:hypothetical protein
MLAMLLLVSIITAFGLFEVLAVRYGADSRPVFDERAIRDRRRNL